MFGKNRNGMLEFLQREVMYREISVAVKTNTETFRGSEHTRFYALGLEYIEKH